MNRVRRPVSRKPIRPRRGALACVVLIAVACAGASSLPGQGFADPGFEGYLASAGGFLRPTTGPWLFGNDAVVVRPPAPHSSTGPLNTWSATLAPLDGEQYVSTYAGLDTLRQSVAFDVAGNYRLSVHAAAPSGSLSIPGVGNFTLGNGEFTFTLGGTAIGSEQTVPVDSGWRRFTADVVIAAPGDYVLGVRNIAAAPYFLNYDGFAIELVPEPSTVGLLGVLALSLGVRRRRSGPAAVCLAEPRG